MVMIGFLNGFINFITYVRNIFTVSFLHQYDLMRVMLFD